MWTCHNCAAKNRVFEKYCTDCGMNHIAHLLGDDVPKWKERPPVGLENFKELLPIKDLKKVDQKTWSTRKEEQKAKTVQGIIVSHPHSTPSIWTPPGGTPRGMPGISRHAPSIVGDSRCDSCKKPFRIVGDGWGFGITVGNNGDGGGKIFILCNICEGHLFSETLKDFQRRQHGKGEPGVGGFGGPIYKEEGK